MNHPCSLQKTLDEDAGKWLCKGLTYDGTTHPCLNEMKSLKDSKFEQGWMCPRGDFCEAKPEDAKDGTHTHFALCIECLRVNHLVEQLPYVLLFNEAGVIEEIEACKY